MAFSSLLELKMRRETIKKPFLLPFRSSLPILASLNAPVIPSINRKESFVPIEEQNA
jgi:hypothetical protein